MSLASIVGIMSSNVGPDSHIYEDPQSTSWRFVHMRHTRFAVDNSAVTLQGTQKTGANTVTNLPREGDLITSLYVVIDLPGISGGKYVDRVGQALVERCQIFLGSQCIDEVTSEYLFMWDALSGQAGKRLGEMIGSDPEAIHPSGEDKSELAQRLYVPIPFWFNAHAPGGVTGNALPLISLQFHAVTVKLNLRSVNDVVVRDDPNAAPKVMADHGISSIGMAVAGKGLAASTKDLSDDDTQVQLEVGYVYLDNEERSRFADSNMEALICQTQQMTKKRSKNATEQHRLYFNHPVSQLIWGVKDPSKGTFDFSGKTLGGKHILDPIASAQLKFNNHSRFNMAGGCSNAAGVPAKYFRTVTPYQCHSRIPDASSNEHVYTYPFSLNPESAQPSGSVNFSRIDNAILELGYDMDGAEHETHVFARNWNILGYSSGMAGLRFSN